MFSDRVPLSPRISWVINVPVTLGRPLRNAKVYVNEVAHGGSGQFQSGLWHAVKTPCGQRAKV